MDPGEGSSRPQKRLKLDVNSGTNDVFISFRGPDSRTGFLSHLVNALRRKQIEVFVDDKLQEGDEIFQALSKAIEKSQISLVIFSKDYASSKYCLDELVKINECREKNGQIVVPIFYKVDPSDVKSQKGCFQDLFARHEERYKVNTMKWRTTMKEVANLSGFHDKKFGNEAELIEEVVRRVLTRLKTMYKVETEDLVGIDEPFSYLGPLISCIEPRTVDVIGIWGMGGSGKTTIARVLFKRMCSEFDRCCFLANVQEQLEKHGVTHVQREMFSMLLEENDGNIDISSGVPVWRLQRQKVLIVLDDISHPEQFNDLIGKRNWYGLGTRIIVTTRDKHVIEKEAKHIYKVEALKSHYALELLKLHAFDEKHPQMNWHDELMLKVLKYAKGIPLALKVLGRLLYGSNVEEWKSQLERLKEIPCADIQNVLKLSYERLDLNQKNIFLCLACFFGNGDENAKELLDVSCGRCIAIDLKTLENKALITVSRDWNDKVTGVTMHDLIREMGRNIEKSGERKHLWDHHEIFRVLKHGQGSEHIESITIDMSTVGDMELSRDCFAKMFNLKFLRIHSSYRLHFPEGVGILSSDIRLFDWDYYPCESLPEKFNPQNLVVLRMRYSRVKKLWSGMQNLSNLKVMDLLESRHLVELPDLSKASNLEVLNLTVCTNLVSVHPSVFSLQKVKEVLLGFCKSLEKLPAIEAMPSLTLLELWGCRRLKCLPDSMCKLTSLESLNLRKCDQLETENLHIILDGLHSLRKLNLEGCSKLNINQLSSLRKLSLWNTIVKTLPVVKIAELSSDIRLFDWEYYPYESLPEKFNPENLVELRMVGSRIKKLWSGLQNLPNLKVMDLEGSQHLVELPDLSKASSLEELDLTFCTNLVSVHPSVFCLRNVKYVFLTGCESLEELPAIVAMPSLTWLDLESCTSLKWLPDSMCKLTSLEELNLSGCSKLNTENLHIILDGLHSLRKLNLDGCRKLNKLPENIIQLSSLTELSIWNTNVETLPKSITNFSNIGKQWLRLQ